MAQIFISYSTKDQAYADEVVQYLERYGYTCFIATRDVQGGEAYDERITEQLSNPDTILVLLFSENSDRSKQVKLEITLAFRNEITIIPFRLQNIAPVGLDYFLQLSQWIDMGEDDKYQKLLNRITQLIDPQIYYNDDNERFVAELFAKHDVDLVPNKIISNQNYNRYVFSYSKEQSALMDYLIPSLQRKFGYFTYGRLMLDDKFPCIIHQDKVNCQIFVDVATNDDQLYTVKPNQIISDGDGIPLFVGFEIDNTAHCVDLTDKHLCINNVSRINIAQIRYLLRKSFTTCVNPCLLINCMPMLAGASDSFSREKLPGQAQKMGMPKTTEGYLLDASLTEDLYLSDGMTSNSTCANTFALGKYLAFSQITTLLFEREVLFSHAKVQNIDEYNKNHAQLPHVFICLNDGYFYTNEMFSTIDTYVNKINCLKYGVHIVLFRHCGAVSKWMLPNFEQHANTLTMHFVHENSSQAPSERQIDFSNLPKAFEMVACKDQYLAVPYVIEKDNAIKEIVVNLKGNASLRTHKTIYVADKHAQWVAFYSLLPDIVSKVQKLNLTEFKSGISNYVSVGEYVLKETTVESILKSYLQLGLVDYVDGKYFLNQQAYNGILNRLHVIS